MKKLIPLALAMAMLLLPSLSIAQPIETPISVSASVSPYLSVTFSFNSLDFGTVTPGTYDKEPVNLNQDNGELYATTDTNADYRVLIYGYDFSGPEMIPISNVEAKVSNTLSDIVNKASPITLSAGLQEAYRLTITQVGVQPTEYYGFWLDVPTGLKAGTYTTTIFIIHENI